jgi:hypothetical protein
MEADTPIPNPPPGRRPRRRPLRRLAVATVVVASCALVSGGVAFAHADGSDDAAPHASSTGERPAARHGALGTVASVDGTTFVLTTRDGRGLTVTTSDATSFRVKRVTTVADVAVGSTIVVKGSPSDDGVIDARWITVVPTTSTDGDSSTVPGGWWRWRHGLTGDVTAVDGATGLLTVETAGGPVTVRAGADTVVHRSSDGTIADVAAGAFVVVHGSYADDGTFAADRVKVLPAASSPPPEPAPAAPTTTVVDTTTTVPIPETPSTEPPTTETPDAPAPDATVVQGSVVAVLGTTLTVSTPDGALVAVITDADTTFGLKDCDRDGGGSQDAAATLADVVVGADVKVAGTVQPDGSVLATRVVLDAGHDADGRSPSGRDGDGGWSGGPEHRRGPDGAARDTRDGEGGDLRGGGARDRDSWDRGRDRD